jgi:hypothetical protein
MNFERGVVNAGPLVALSLMGRLDLLGTLFRELWIRWTVLEFMSDAVIERACEAAGQR